MKLIFSSIILFFVQLNLFAQSTSIDFGRSTSKNESISLQDLRSRFEVLGEVFVLDQNGKLLFQADESRIWRFGKSGDIVSHWLYSAKGIPDLAIKHTWSLNEKGNILVHIQQYDFMKRKDNYNDVVLGKLLREENIILKDFSAITWLAHDLKNQKIYLRLIPRLSEKKDLISVGDLPITLTMPVIFDNKGRLWAQGNDLEGRYISIKTSMGLFAISYSQFKGAKEIGYVIGGQIVLKADSGLVLNIRSSNLILNSSKPAKIYGFIDLSKVSENPNSFYSSSSSNEKQFLENIK